MGFIKKTQRVSNKKSHESFDSPIFSHGSMQKPGLFDGHFVQYTREKTHPTDALLSYRASMIATLLEEISRQLEC